MNEEVKEVAENYQIMQVKKKINMIQEFKYYRCLRAHSVIFLKHPDKIAFEKLYLYCETAGNDYYVVFYSTGLINKPRKNRSSVLDNFP